MSRTETESHTGNENENENESESENESENESESESESGIVTGTEITEQNVVMSRMIPVTAITTVDRHTRILVSGILETYEK